VELATTVVNPFELFLGAFKHREAKTNLTAVKGLSSTLKILSFTEEASELAAKILCGLEKAGRGIETRDLIVGATALEEGYAVATENTPNEYQASQSYLNKNYYRDYDKLTTSSLPGGSRNRHGCVELFFWGRR